MCGSLDNIAGILQRVGMGEVEGAGEHVPDKPGIYQTIS